MKLERRSAVVKFAWFPIQTVSKKWLWLVPYVQVTAGRFQTTGKNSLFWKYEYRKYTRNEWTIELLKD